MEYKEIEFKQFLKENKLKVIDLPEPIQEKIDIFYRLYELLDTIQESDLQELQEQVAQLDIEILEDIEEQYEDQLTNNEPLEKLLESEGIKKSVPKKKRSDESILDELVKMGRTQNIRKSELTAMGIKRKIKRDMVIGKHVLKRTSVFFHVYRIVALKK
jgi:hypothetical protein